MKDSGVATLVGEAPTTSGAGSSAMSYLAFYARSTNDFKRGVLQDFFFSYTDNRRFDGTPIENIGVPSDHVILPTREDVLATSRNFIAQNTQFDKIVKIMKNSKVVEAPTTTGADPSSYI
jgi:hypothetical protein